MAALKLLLSGAKAASSLDNSTDDSIDSAEILQLLGPLGMQQRRRNSRSPRVSTVDRPNMLKLNLEPNTNRFYYEDMEEFKNLLKLLNQRNKGDANGPLKCVGSVNTAMRMCVQCHDVGKDERKTDKYYIYRKEVAKSRTVLCHGCVGAKLLTLEMDEHGEGGD